MRFSFHAGIGFLLAALGGCCAAERHQGATPSAVPLGPSPNRYLIYSPDTEETFVQHDYESNWPSGVAGSPSGEFIAYREIVLDRQDRRGSREDQYYRRFESIRTGRLVR